VRLEKLAGPAGDVIISYRVGKPLSVYHTRNDQTTARAAPPASANAAAVCRPGASRGDAPNAVKRVGEPCGRPGTALASTQRPAWTTVDGAENSAATCTMRAL